MKIIWLCVGTMCLIALGMFFLTKYDDYNCEASDPWSELRKPYVPDVKQPVRKQYDLRPDVRADEYGRKTYIQQ